jgi:hypothetical protein
VGISHGYSDRSKQLGQLRQKIFRNTNIAIARFDILTAMSMMIQVFWDLTQ